jgi:UDP-N-acetyl-D-mannosaminuronic acid dehydrogenase
VNNYKTVWVIDTIRRAVDEVAARTGRKPRVACLGLAFKPDIDDLRESPAMQVALALQAQGIYVLAVEPNITAHPSFELLDLETALASADVVAVLVKHRQFVAAFRDGRPAAGQLLDFVGI